MTAPGPDAITADGAGSGDPGGAPAPRPRRRLRRRWIAALAAGGLALLLAVTAWGGGAWLRSDGGRAFLVSQLDGMKTGRFGRLGVEGLAGDPLSDFTVERITITDEQGVWLEVQDLRIDWRWTALLGRRFHADEISAGRLRLIRRPAPEESDEPSSPMPIGLEIDRFAAEVELLEGFSKDYGRWTLEGAADMPRRGAKSVRLDARSLTRPGDYLRGSASMGEDIADLRLNLQAEEALGGPLSGALGYPHDRPFSLSARVDGRIADAVIRSGDVTPLRVQGRFEAERSRLSGFIDFKGSDLLAPFARSLGDTARFGLVANPSRAVEGRHSFAWSLEADNLTSRAQGQVDLNSRSAPDGLRLEIATPSLTRLAGATLGGAAVYAGVFTGDLSTWRIDGRLTLNEADLASYRARSISGPVNLGLARGRFDIGGELTAAGGAADGVIGALLGETPRVRLGAARLADGALLFQRIEAQGRAFQLDGSGSRGLTGRLDFRARAEITDAARLRPGARGAFAGTIQASSGGGRDPWRLDFDGRGRGLVFGLGELDRLLGEAPRLQIDARWAGDRLEVGRALLTGAEAQAQAQGLIGGDGRLQMALDWSAQGPFGVGPIEIEGAMSGDGALTGDFAHPQADLNAAFDRINTGALVLTQARLTLGFRQGDDGSHGRIAVTAGSNHGPARGAANFVFGDDHLRLTEVDVDAGGVDARGAITLSNNLPSSADLAFSARPGAFLTAGELNGRVRLTDTADDSALLAVTGRNLRFPGSPYVVRTLQLGGRGSLERLPFTLVADVGGPTPVRFDGDGVYARVDGDNRVAAQTLTLNGQGRVRDVAFSTRSPAVFAMAADGRTARVDLNLGGGVLLGELRSDSSAALLQAELTSVELGAVAPDLRGRVTGRVALRGRGDELTGSANITLAGARSIDAPRGLAIDGSINAMLVDNQLRIVADARSGDQASLHADLNLPVVAAAAPLRLAVERTRPLSGEVKAAGQVQPIWDLFLGGERSLSGLIDLDARLAGTLNAPRVNGRLEVSEGAFHDSATGLRLSALALVSRFDDEAAVVERFSARDGDGGAVRGQGRLALREGGGSSVRLDFTRFRIIDNDIAKARASGAVTVTRPANGDITLAGRLDIDEARIEANPPGANGIVRMDVVEINRPGVDPEEPVAPRRDGPRIALDITLSSPGGDVFVIGRGLNVEMAVNARVRGTLTEPVLEGTANVVRGDYEFAGKRFVFDDSGSVTLSTDPARIRLNLLATREDPALTAAIRVTGTAARPEIALTSTPSLPQDEILSQVLFGRSASQLSPIEAAQLASGVAALAGGAGFDVIGNLRQLAGLDRLSFGGEASALTVAGGRYITDDVYLEIIGGGEGGAAVSVEWQVRRNLTVSSKFGGQGETSLSIRWRRESGRRDRRPNR